MRIGYLGVGNMGQPMAGKLLDAGHDLSIYDAREGAMRPLLERQASGGLTEGVGGHMRYGHCLSADT